MKKTIAVILALTMLVLVVLGGCTTPANTAPAGSGSSAAPAGSSAPAPAPAPAGSSSAAPAAGGSSATADDSGYGFTSVKSSDEEDPANATTNYNTSGKTLVIGIAVSGYQAPYFKALVSAAQDAAKVQNVELKVLDASFDPQKQASQVASLIQQKCDAIDIIPCDSTAIIPSMQKVKDAGIPLFIVNTQNEASTNNLIVSFIGASMEDEAAMAAQSIKDLLPNGGNIVEIMGQAGTFPAAHRDTGFAAAMADSPNIKILAKQNAGWDRAQAQSLMEDYLTRFDKIDALYAQDDNMAIGAIQAIKAAGRMNEIKVVSISGTIEGYAAIKAGEIYSTVSQPPDWEGRGAVIYPVMHLCGKEVAHWQKTPIAQVTKDNVDQFKGVW